MSAQNPIVVEIFQFGKKVVDTSYTSYYHAASVAMN